MEKNITEIGKLTIALTMLVLFVSTASAQPVATDFGVNDTSGDPDTFVLIPVNITNVQNESIAGIVFDISFDSSVINLTEAHVQRGDLTSVWDSPGYNPANGRISIVFGGSGTEIPINGSGSVVVLNFSVVGAPGAKSAMNISGIQLSGLEGALGTATANNGTFIITGQIVIDKNLTTIAVSPPTATLTAGATQTFTATAMDPNNTPIPGININFTSDNTTVGTVVPENMLTGADGIATTTFTAGAEGIAMITANNDTVTGSANVTVTVSSLPSALRTITVSPPTATLAINGTQIFNTTALDQNGAPMSGINIVWASNNTAVGNVSSLTATTDVFGGATTTFTAGAQGIAMITANNDTVAGSANVTVTAVKPPTNVTVAIRTIEKESLRLGESTNITVDISSNISQALSLRENIPAGWNLTRVTVDVDAFKNSTNEGLWFNVEPGIHKTVIYRLTAPGNASIGTYHINGTISSSSGVIAVVQGDNTITLDIIAFYRRLGSDSDIVETTDVLTAVEDWRNNRAPSGFERAITTQEVLALIDEWIAS